MSAKLKSLQALLDEIRLTVEEISPPELRAALDRGERFVLVDVREPQEWGQGVLPGAVPIPRGLVELKLPQMLPDPDAMIVCYCQGGIRSLMAAESLKRMGYKKVLSLSGGFHGWANEHGLPVSRP